ncbi:DNA topoisomerase III [Fodinisporobacter ferrooxydans]|uniref:DNA topoisomerase 3 n=1 Tax=Fodinisporobacter ferrooxydans TaxID=2901836 RepID=A0ABY4CKU3_9BACL|nr:DNA topoisomerase III [Alicyclobacillaceae bacterium MYW30-H2]
MGKVLVLAEKPSVGRDIARVLQCAKKGNGFFEGERYIVTWALGHLVTLADPEAYGETYKTWKIEDLPMLPSPLKLVVIKQSSRQFYAVKAQLNRSDVNNIVIATDAGREGELVARWIIEMARVKKPIQRLWISSVTDQAIRDGFRKLRDGREYEHLFASAVARAEADWLVGINATRALTCKYNAQLSCGRVQTPTLAMIAQREEEIQRFQPRTFYGIAAVANNKLRLIWQDRQTKDIKTFSKETCDRILQQLKNKHAEIIDVDKSYKKTYAPQLYDLTELQRDAHKFFDYSAKETLSILQRLYEQHKLLTYPRTDSRYISADIVDTLQERVKACNVGPYGKMASKVLKHPIRPGKSFVDDTKVSDHHAIIPTEEPVYLSKLSDKERKLYDLVIKRFFAVLYPPFEFEQTTIRAKIGEELFLAKGKMVIAAGWKEVYENPLEEEDSTGISEQLLPNIQIGDRLPIMEISQTKGETKPPEHFNEGSLLSAMENPVRYMASAKQDLIQTIGETGGLGTVATRADIIEKLFHSFFIEKKGKDIFLTSKGKQLLELVPNELKSPRLTAEWEQKLALISKGLLSKHTFVNEMRSYAKAVVNEITFSEKQFRHDNITGTRCPECGKPMLEVNGKKGKMLICQDRECGHRKNISKTTNARCPNCHKRLELRGEGEGQIFVCSCGFKEKLAAFNERRSKEKHTKVSKRDISNYLQKQNKENAEPKNPALAEALAKLKLDKV